MQSGSDSASSPANRPIIGVDTYTTTPTTTPQHRPRIIDCPSAALASPRCLPPMARATNAPVPTPIADSIMPMSHAT